MCLETTQIEPLNKWVQRQRCYKAVLYINNKYYTPYVGKCLGTELQNKWFRDKAKESILKNSKTMAIDEGFFHAFVDLEAAKQSLVKLQTMCKKGTIELWECIIPAKSDFYIGTKGDICSKKIIFKKKII